VLDGRRYTASLPAEARQFLGLPEAGYVEQGLVLDGQVLTAQGSAYVDFGLAAGRLFGCFEDEAHFDRVARFYRNQEI
jgi:hypothetical protein